MGKLNVIIVAGEPGNVSFVIHLIPIIEHEGYDCIVVADGASKRILEQQKINIYADTLTETEVLSLSPHFVIVGTSADKTYFGLHLIEFCKTHDIITVGIVIASMSVSFRFSGNSGKPLRYSPDWILVTSEETSYNFQRIGFPKEKIVHVENPHLEYLAKLGRIKGRGRTKHLGINSKGKRVILFAAEPLIPDENISESYGQWPQSYRDFERCKLALHAFCESMKSQDTSKNINILRLHPLNDELEFLEFESNFDLVSLKQNNTDLLLCCDLVVGLTSSLLQEAAVLGIPCISIISCKADDRDIPYFIKKNIISAYTPKDLEIALSANLSSPIIQLSGSGERVGPFISRL